MNILKHITEKDLVESIGMKRGFALQVLDKLNNIQETTSAQDTDVKTQEKSGLTHTIQNATNIITEQAEIFKNKFTDKFVLKNGTTEGITRLDAQREMIIGLFDKHIFSHSKVCVVYFSRIKWEDLDETDEKKIEKIDCMHDDICEGILLGEAINDILGPKQIGSMAPRLFQFELFTNENKENVLSITGPEKMPKGYKCKQFYAVKSTMNKLIEIGKNVMNNHGKYNYVYNNCRYFTSSYLDAVKTETEPIKLKANTKDITDALVPYKKSGHMNIPSKDITDALVPYKKSGHMNIPSKDITDAL
eukprot:499049_1